MTEDLYCLSSATKLGGREKPTTSLHICLDILPQVTFPPIPCLLSKKSHINDTKYLFQSSKRSGVFKKMSFAGKEKTKAAPLGSWRYHRPSRTFEPEAPAPSERCAGSGADSRAQAAMWQQQLLLFQLPPLRLFPLRLSLPPSRSARAPAAVCTDAHVLLCLCPCSSGAHMTPV